MSRNTPRQTPARIEIAVAPQTRPEVVCEEQTQIVSFAYPRASLAAIRYKIDCWSLRIWEAGPGSGFEHEIVFTRPIDPGAFILRLENGLLEFQAADLHPKNEA